MRYALCLLTLAVLFEPVQLAGASQGLPDARPADAFAVEGLVRDGLFVQECTGPKAVNGIVTEVVRGQGERRAITSFAVRSSEERVWVFDALKLKKQLPPGFGERFESTLAEGRQVEVVVFLCGENFEAIVDGLRIRRSS
jgi:hypothetical protein